MEWESEDYHWYTTLRQVVPALHPLQGLSTERGCGKETFSLKNSGDFFRKIVILDGNAKARTDEDGVMYVGVIPFLLEEAGRII